MQGETRLSKRMASAVFLTFILFVLSGTKLGTMSALASDAAFTGTNVGGAITTNTTWKVIGSPYIVSENVVVLANVFLTIEPGVTVKFGNGTSIIVDGILVAEGSPSSTIMFTSNASSPAAGDWGSIGTRTGGRIAEVGWTIVEYSTEGIAPTNPSSAISACAFRKNGVGVSGSNVNVADCTFQNNGDGVNAANVSIVNCEFSNNTNAIVGLGTCAVQDTKVWNNSGNGILVNGTVTNCSVYDNGGYGGSSIFDDVVYSWSVIYESYRRPASSYINCSIYGNEGYGVLAASIVNCSVYDNRKYGVAGTAINCLVFNNSEVGIRGNATSCLVFKNDGSGIVGSCTNCIVYENGEDGVSDPSGWDAPSVVNCRIYGNNLTGINVSGNPTGAEILNSAIFGNEGYGIYFGGYDSLVSNCDIYDNLAGGIVLPTVFHEYNVPSVRSQITNSKIHGNLFGILESCIGYYLGGYARELLVSGCNISHNVQNGIGTEAKIGAYNSVADTRLAVKDTIVDSNGRFGICLNSTNEADGLQVSLSILELTNCSITNHTVGLAGKIGNVVDCVVANNSEIGLVVFQVPESQPVWYGSGWIDITGIHQNNIYNNGFYDINNQITFGQDLNATLNWWGTNNITEIGASIYDYYKDYNLSRVFFEPILTSPIPEFPLPIILTLFMIASLLTAALLRRKNMGRSRRQKQ